jgi:hypothetical protein
MFIGHWQLMKVKQSLQKNCDFDIVSSTGTPLSQSSIIATPSKAFNYSVANQRIPEGSASSRKADKKNKIAYEEGQLLFFFALIYPNDIAWVMLVYLNKKINIKKQDNIK